MAAIGRVQLTRFETEFKPLRITLAQRYKDLLVGTPSVRTLPVEYGPIVPHIFPVYFTNGARDAVRDALAERGIETGIHYKPNHLLTLYGGGGESLPVAERLYEETLTLPLHPVLKDVEQYEIVDVVIRVATKAEQAA